MRKCVLLGALLAVMGCGGGDDEPDTPYGPVGEVLAYREAVDAVIDSVNAIQADLEGTTYGSGGLATGENLAAAYQALCPRLEAVLAALAQIQPPESLLATHADIGRMVRLRLDALERAAEGWQVEQSGSFAAAEPIYDEAEDLLAQASALAAATNAALEQVDVALAEAGVSGPTG